MSTGAKEPGRAASLSPKATHVGQVRPGGHTALVASVKAIVPGGTAPSSISSSKPACAGRPPPALISGISTTTARRSSFRRSGVSRTGTRSAAKVSGRSGTILKRNASATPTFGPNPTPSSFRPIPNPRATAGFTPLISTPSAMTFAHVKGKTPHSARHAMGRHIMEKTKNPAAVQRQLGHSNVAYALQ